MGYITISGDSNGDLHDANMHNEKFGAIASVINGNIGIENLLFPNSQYAFTGNAIGSNAGATASYYDIGAVATSGVPDAMISSNTANHFNVVQSSLIKVPFTATITENVLLIVTTMNSYDAAKTLSFQLQSSSLVNGTYTQIGSTVTNSCYSDPMNLTTFTITGTTGQTIPAGHFIRIVVGNNDAGDYPPNLQFTIRLKTQHV